MALFISLITGDDEVVKLICRCPNCRLPLPSVLSPRREHSFVEVRLAAFPWNSCRLLVVWSWDNSLLSFYLRNNSFKPNTHVNGICKCSLIWFVISLWNSSLIPLINMSLFFRWVSISPGPKRDGREFVFILGHYQIALSHIQKIPKELSHPSLLHKLCLKSLFKIFLRDFLSGVVVISESH